MASSRTCKWIGCLSMIVVAIIIALGLYTTLESSSGSGVTPVPPDTDPLGPPPPSNSVLGVFPHAAVVSHGAPCAGIGREMLSAGGNAIDAAIATLLCEGVCVMQSMGVGGGFLMTFYNKTEGKAYSLVARETAPAASNATMYLDQTDKLTLGPLSAGVPGELKGYQAAHKRFGSLPWRDLFQPTIKLCEEGVPVSKRMAETFISQDNNIKLMPTFVQSILNSTGGRYPEEGETIKLPVLAQTLRVIADSDLMADELYNGRLTKGFVKDIQDGGGIITEQDMNDYQIRWEEPLVANISDSMTVYSAALPGSGVLVNFMLRLLDGPVQLAYSDLQRSQLMIEAFKHAYGRRSDLGDPYFANKTVLNKVLAELTQQSSIMEVRKKLRLDWTTNNISFYGADYLTEDHGTNNVVVVDEMGNGVSVTSTVNLLFGSKFVSKSTGILLNNEMDDFSTPGKANFFGLMPSEANMIAPGKRPLSSMSPIVVIDKNGDVRLVLGAAGGSMITTQVTAVAIRNLWLGKNIKEAIDVRRFHHQLVPMNITYEYGITKDIVDGWQSIGHSTVRLAKSNILAVVTGIARLGDQLTANCDWRKPGAVDGL